MRALSPRRARMPLFILLWRNAEIVRETSGEDRVYIVTKAYMRRAVLNRHNYFRAKLKDFSETAREDPRRFLIIPASVLPKLFPLRFDDCVAVNVFPAPPLTLSTPYPSPHLSRFSVALVLNLWNRKSDLTEIPLRAAVYNSFDSPDLSAPPRRQRRCRGSRQGRGQRNAFYYKCATRRINNARQLRSQWLVKAC